MTTMSGNTQDILRGFEGLNQFITKLDPGQRHDRASDIEEAIQRATSTADYGAWLDHTASVMHLT